MKQPEEMKQLALGTLISTHGARSSQRKPNSSVINFNQIYQTHLYHQRYKINKRRSLGKGRHRKFHPSDQTCPCEVGYVKGESADENTGDCTKKIYEICPADTFRSQQGECLTASEFENECLATGCPENTFVGFDSELGICECQLKSLDETCNTDCRRASAEIFRLVCPDPVTNKDPYLRIGDTELTAEFFEGKSSK